MNKVVLAGLVVILARDCDIGGPRFRGPIEGTWGGENAGLIAFDTTAHVHIGCTAGDTKQALVADEQGRFDAPGRYNITLYPVASPSCDGVHRLARASCSMRATSSRFFVKFSP